MTKIKVIVCEPRKAPEIKEIEWNVDSIRLLLGGWFSVTGLRTNPYSKEAYYLLYKREDPVGLQLNRKFRSKNIYGVFFICLLQSTGEAVSLTDEDINKFEIELDTVNNYN